MAKYTDNIKLEKQQGNEYISIEGLNENFDKIDTAIGNSSKFEKASGTGTAIILNGIVLEDGASKAFIVSANNNGAATTINGKKLYFAGTTVTPTLQKDKLVRTWYSAINDCFYTDFTRDADTVDGKHASEFSMARGELTDANLATDNGGYLIRNTASNAPFSDTWATVFAMQGGTGAIIQIAVAVDGRTANRHFDGATWGQWKHFANIGYLMANGDFNKSITAGSYRIDTGWANKPVGAEDYGVLTVFKGSAGDTLLQMYMSYNNNQVYTRTGWANGASWSSWAKLWNSVNNPIKVQDGVVLSHATILAKVNMMKADGMVEGSFKLAGATNVSDSPGGNQWGYVRWWKLASDQYFVRFYPEWSNIWYDRLIVGTEWNQPVWSPAHSGYCLDVATSQTAPATDFIWVW